MPSIFVRPISSYKHQPKGRQISSSSKKPTFRWKKWMTYASALLGVAIVGVGLADWLFVRNEQYMMQRIEIVHEGESPYIQVPDQQLVKELEGRHYYLTKYRMLLSKMLTTHPLLSGLRLQPTATKGLYQLVVSYDPVVLKLRFQDRDYGLVNNQLYPIKQGGSGMVLIIPSYFTGMNLSGLFYMVPAEQLATQYQIITNGLSDQNIQKMTYYPAAKQIQVNTLTQEIYFDVSANVFEQLRKYRTLSQYPKEVPNQRIIDLGALEEGVMVYP